MKTGTGEYRLRKGLFGKCILQEAHNFPKYNGGHVDARTREIVWLDVDYKNAPRAFKLTA